MSKFEKIKRGMLASVAKQAASAAEKRAEWKKVLEPIPTLRSKFPGGVFVTASMAIVARTYMPVEIAGKAIASERQGLVRDIMFSALMSLGELGMPENALLMKKRR